MATGKSDYKQAIGLSSARFHHNAHPKSLFHDIIMTHKRKHFENRDGKSALHSKRSRLNNPDSSADLPTSSPSRIDPTYGQRSAFPGLDDSNGDNNLFYGPASDGIEYLRMVR